MIRGINLYDLESSKFAHQLQFWKKYVSIKLILTLEPISLLFPKDTHQSIVGLGNRRTEKNNKNQEIKSTKGLLQRILQQLVGSKSTNFAHGMSSFPVAVCWTIPNGFYYSVKKLLFILMTLHNWSKFSLWVNAELHNDMKNRDIIVWECEYELRKGNIVYYMLQHLFQKRVSSNQLHRLNRLNSKLLPVIV